MGYSSWQNLHGHEAVALWKKKILITIITDALIIIPYSLSGVSMIFSVGGGGALGALHFRGGTNILSWQALPKTPINFLLFCFRAEQAD